METIKINVTLIFISVIMAFSCDNKATVVSKDCDCNGIVKSTVADKQGTVEVIDVDGKRTFRISNKAENLYFIVCNTTTIASIQKVSQTEIKFSGDVKGFCDDPTVHLLPPIYKPIIITKLEVVE